MFQSRLFKRWALALVIAGTALIGTGAALADKVVLKDGTVYQGKIAREGDKFLYIVVQVGTVKSEVFVNKEDIKTLERDDPTPKTDENLKKEEEKAAVAKAEARHTGATRVAILNFGCPSEWQGKYDDTVGIQVNADSFHRAIPLLEKDHVDVVVVRIKSGGGALSELEKFHRVFENEYKKKFRTVAWVESGISAAAMSPWPIEEFYFYPQGSLGACTGWHGNLVAMKGVSLEIVLAMMEKVSAMGKKDPAIMRAMQIMEPLSVDIDDNGEVHWRQDEDGKYLLNKKGNIFTMKADQAIQFKFAKGIAGTKEELVKVMGLQEVEWAGQAAADLINKSIADNDGAEKHLQKVYAKYQLALGLADQLQDKERRGIELSKAKNLLAEMRRMNKLFEQVPAEWFEEQEEIIKKIAQRP